MEKLIQQYVKNNGTLFKVDHISRIRDGGTVAITTTVGSKFYLDNKDYTFHVSYPTTEQNQIKDEPTIAYVMSRVEVHKKELEQRIDQNDYIIDKINIAK